MACSKYEYVKRFETTTSLLPNTFIVVRIDGHSFHRFTSAHGFVKPNDPRALHLMNYAAQKCMEEIQDIVIAYGQSDEFSFVLRREASLYKRREAKIVSTICSLFTSNYVFYWARFFGGGSAEEKVADDAGVEGTTDWVDNTNQGPVELKYPPSFDARAVCYPTTENLRDYLSWRQADCHINNLYNTSFWALVQDKENPRSEREAQDLLKDTDSAAKNELLFKQYGINYNKLPELFKKGSVLYRRPTIVKEISSRDGREVTRTRYPVVVEHRDIIGTSFWEENPHILNVK
ncbi:tRNA-histidine guanylyltransferase 1-like [Borealophlyctis nickersoniae]|nr:tRNA-histidine guanylyltransferase 1-like [Borealophlyctis nickersoniae]